MPKTLQREFSLDAIDGKLLHHLQQHGRLSFAELARRVRLTTPAVIERVRKLEDAGYLACTKSFDGRMPKTEYRLTAAGRRALEKYLDHMEALIRVTREA